MDSQLESILSAIESVSLELLFGLILVELLVLWGLARWRSKKESWVSLACFALAILPYELFFGLLEYQLMEWVYDHARLVTLGGEWWVWALAFAFFDLSWWGVHFAAHKVRFLWCIHGVHHTPTEMNMSVAIRGSLLDFVEYAPLMVWLPILGFHPLMVLTVNVLARLYGVFTHLHEGFLRRTPLLDRVLITPSLHRVHHAKNSVYIDTNYANMFSFWDRLFGTRRLEVEGMAPVFGVTDERVDAGSVVSSQVGLWWTLLADLRSAPSWIDRFKHLVMPPDWRPSLPAAPRSTA